MRLPSPRGSSGPRGHFLVSGPLFGVQLCHKHYRMETLGDVVTAEHSQGPLAVYRPPGRPGVDRARVHQAADQLLAAGERPTIERVRKLVGGSPNTLGPILNEWWKGLSGRLHSRAPGAFERLPGQLALIAEAFYHEALVEARRRVQAEVSMEREKAERASKDLDVQAHLLSRREQDLAELVRAYRERSEELEARIKVLERSERKARAAEAALQTRLKELLEELVRRKRKPARPKKAAGAQGGTKRKRKASKATKPTSKASKATKRTSKTSKGSKPKKVKPPQRGRTTTRTTRPVPKKKQVKASPRSRRSPRGAPTRTKMTGQTPSSTKRKGRRSDK